MGSLSTIRAIAGRKGGLVRSARQSEAARINGERGLVDSKCAVCGRSGCQKWHTSCAKRVALCSHECIHAWRRELTYHQKQRDVVTEMIDGKVVITDLSQPTTK